MSALGLSWWHTWPPVSESIRIAGEKALVDASISDRASQVARSARSTGEPAVPSNCTVSAKGKWGFVAADLRHDGLYDFVFERLDRSEASGRAI